MTGLEIGLLIIGAVFFIGSFFISEKISSSDMNEISGLSEDQIKALVEKQLNDADSKIDQTISDKVDEKSEEFIAEADKETNNRIMSIGEYADSVYDSMTKTHDEILFMYQMLNDKQETMTKLTKSLGEAESHVRELLSESEKQREATAAGQNDTGVPAPADDSAKETETDDNPVFPPLPQQDSEVKSEEEPESKKEEEAMVISDLKAQDKEASDNNKACADKPQNSEKTKNSSQEDTKKIREKVISMYHQGYSLLDIAKETGKGIGEVTLILELFDEKEEEASE
ncbi:MAG: DUF6115 domain-containing protein [Candidatus Weimeria sp.]